MPTLGFVSVSYSNLSASYSHNLDGQNADDLNYTAYKIGLFYEKMGLDLEYTEFDRFRINDSSGFNRDLPDSEKQRPDISLRLINGSLYYFPLCFRYGLEQALEPHEKKLTGFGAGIIGSYSQVDIYAPGGLVPEEWRAAFGPDGAFESGFDQHEYTSGGGIDARTRSPLRDCTCCFWIRSAKFCV